MPTFTYEKVSKVIAEVESSPELIKLYSTPLMYIDEISKELQYKANTKYLEQFSYIDTDQERTIIFNKIHEYPLAFRWRILAILNSGLSTDVQLEALDKFALFIMLAFAQYSCVGYINMKHQYKDCKVTPEEIHRDADTLIDIISNTIENKLQSSSIFTNKIYNEGMTWTVKLVYAKYFAFSIHSVRAVNKHNTEIQLSDLHSEMKKQWNAYLDKTYKRNLKLISTK